MTTWSKRWFRGGNDQALALEAGQAVALGGARPVSISVERGLVVITREGDPVDHVLGAGQVLVLPGRGKVVAWALEPSRAAVRDAA